MMTVFWAQLLRDLRLSLRQSSDVMMVLAFFIMGAALFPLGIGPDPSILGRIAPGIIWVLALLAVILSLDRVFQADYRDGSLEIILLSPAPLTLIVGARILAHWLTTGFPLLICAPIIGIMLNLNEDVFGVLLLGLLLGTPCLSLIGTVGSALVLGARRAGLLVALLVLPLYIPVLIFGVGAIDAAMNGFPAKPHLLLLASCLAASVPLCCFASAAALRHALD